MQGKASVGSYFKDNEAASYRILNLNVSLDSNLMSRAGITYHPKQIKIRSLLENLQG